MQLLALYLMTNPHATMLGLYYLPLVVARQELALTKAQITKGLERCAHESITFAAYDHAAEVVWVYEMARFQLGNELKASDHRVKAVQRAYAETPSNRFLGPFHDKYGLSHQLGPRRPIGQAPWKPLGSPLEGAPRSPVHLSPSPSPSPGVDLRARFEKFWSGYPRKVGKDAAWLEWQRLGPGDDLTDHMLAAVSEQRASAQWLKDGGQFIPHPRTWLHQGRWKDAARVERLDPPVVEPWVCPHQERCSHHGMCENKLLLGPEKYPVKAVAS